MDRKTINKGNNMKTDLEEKEFIDPIATTPVIFWILQSIGSAILGWITWSILDRFKNKKTDVDTDTKEEVSYRKDK